MAIRGAGSRLLAAAGGVIESLTTHDDDGSADALGLLKADHENVKRLFEEVLEDTSSAISGQRKTVEQILAELELHAKVEETIFYPALQKKTKRDTEERNHVFEAYEEHGSMKELIRKIKRSTGRDETMRAKVKVLKEIVEHHVEEEESTLFDEAREQLNERALRKLGEEMLAFKQRAQRSGARGAARKKSGGKKTAAKAPARRKKARA